VEYHYLKTRRMHKITQVVNTEYIQQVLDMAKAGKPFSELAVALTNEEFSVSSFQFSEFFIDIKYLTLFPTLKCTLLWMTSWQAGMKSLKRLFHSSTQIDWI